MNTDFPYTNPRPAKANAGAPKGRLATTSATPAAKVTALSRGTPDGPTGAARGFSAGRSLERERLAEVAEFAKSHGQEAKALDLLANTELDADAIKGKLGGVAVWDKALARLAGENAR